MNRYALGVGAAAMVVGAAALADPNTDVALEIDGVAIKTIAASAHADNPIGDTLISGWHYRNDETRALQLDDFDNPAFLAVELGRELWEAADGASGKSCADCHGGIDGFAGLRANMPKWSEAAGRPLTLEQWINWSRKEHQGAEPWKWESEQMLGMTAAIAVESRGMPMDVQTDGPMAEWFEKGRDLYYTRTGQLDFACASCHEANSGMMLRADHLSQGHLNGFPTYRLKWQGIGSIHRRLKGCVQDTRAEPYAVGSDELVALELYVSWRGEGLDIEAPAVRQ
ncbi:sulfur oxidation c-type cytochrome SoxA [Rubrimonas cliftonensis]|uniref:SoxAX cytochrome complex subunit A n=1 Tax=Rubrimonas cliftonensis TaxID=89524 RepID=A0A1H4DGN6_9RHOB|nr:sulfur oxidation c-type cytochrome SoxA [Rubrimonas cliftonensis]SEA71609.1 sulfur-oxidizing protein SoxA [Rubrimonas cliftonensis]